MKSNLRKRKASSDSSELSTHPKTRRLASPENSNSDDSTCESVCCSSSNNNGSSSHESLKAADLKEEGNKVNVELMATSAGDSVDFRDRSETTPPRADEIGELESTAMPPRRRFNNPRMPSESDIEDFFSNAEKELQKQFIDRYNFDIAKDEPLEGRYEWVEIQVKP